MRGKNEKNKPEIEAAFAVAMLLQNILILAVMCGLVWFLHAAVTESNSLNVVLRNGFLQ